jgi:hypothetical protein
MGGDALGRRGEKRGACSLGVGTAVHVARWLTAWARAERCLCWCVSCVLAGLVPGGGLRLCRYEFVFGYKFGSFFRT